jgi:putative Holliday junction resolvase
MHALLSGRPATAHNSRPDHVIVIGAPYNGLVRWLGVDPGGKRLGLAVGDEFTAAASPVDVVAYPGCGAAAELIAAAVEDHAAAGAVVGLPTDADGEETPACARSHALADALDQLGVAVHLQSEYLSSNEARRRARLAGRRRSAAVDDLAASGRRIFIRDRS